MRRLYLAPMQGLTDAAFRSICFELGCEGAVTEMIETGTYAYTRKRLALIEESLVRLPQETWLAVQLIGKEPVEMALCAERVTRMNRFDAIEVNMGCPSRKVTTGGSGSALMKDIVRAREILCAVMASTNLPVHLKIRLGWDDQHRNAAEIARMAQQVGVQALTIHGRTRSQFYSGQADWAGIAGAAHGLLVPVIANGDVKQPEDVERALAETGARAVSIGRAALIRPWIFEDIRRLSNGLPIERRSVRERAQLLMRHAQRSCLIKEESMAIKRMRKFTAWYLDGMTGLSELCSRVNRLERLDDFCDEIEIYCREQEAVGDIYPHEELAKGSARLSLPG